MKLVEEVLPSLDLTDVIDTSGAFIPGHGTPTVILAGRNQPPTQGQGKRSPWKARRARNAGGPSKGEGLVVHRGAPTRSRIRRRLHLRNGGCRSDTCEAPLVAWGRWSYRAEGNARAQRLLVSARLASSIGITPPLLAKTTCSYFRRELRLRIRRRAPSAYGDREKPSGTGQSCALECVVFPTTSVLRPRRSTRPSGCASIPLALSRRSVINAKAFGQPIEESWADLV